MKTIFKLIVVSFVLVFALTACSPKITAGYVVDKEYKEAYTTTSTSCVAYNSEGMCLSYMPQTHHHPATWRVVISGQDENQVNVTERFRVSEARYEQINIGDFFDSENY